MQRAAYVGTALALAGCGRIGFAQMVGDAVTDGRSVDTGDGAPACVHPALADNFDDGVTSTAWTIGANAGVTVTESGGHMSVALAASVATTAYGSYTSTTMYDVRDHCVGVAVVTTPDPLPTTEMSLQIVGGSGVTGVNIHGGVLESFTNFGTYVVLSSVTFDPVNHRILSVREAAGTTYWETSDGSGAFGLQFSEPTPLDMSSVALKLTAGTYASDPAPGSAVFDDFDLP